MSCPYCGRDCSRLVRRCPYCGVSYSPETRANRLRDRDLHGGHFYPLEVEKALSLMAGHAYIAAAAKRARREPSSARNVFARKAATTRELLRPTAKAGERR